MKIKKVCDITGLSDRTIRYYIEQGLISPSYTENYLGRKSFDFSEDNITDLNRIAILRSFDFSVGEIRDIILNLENSMCIIQNVKRRTENALLAGERKLSALARIDADKTYTLAELAEKLSVSQDKSLVQNEREKINLKNTMKSVGKKALVFLAVWLPILACCIGVLLDITRYSYPVLRPKAIFRTLLFLLPSFLMLTLSRKDFSRKKALKRVLLTLCVLSAPVSFFSSMGTVIKSETTSFQHYLELDAECLANRNTFFHELFPDWPHYFENRPEGGVLYYPDAEYYYRYMDYVDYTYDIYAQWPLDEGSFEEEAARVTALFGNQNRYRVTEIQKGKFRCWIAYMGDQPFRAVTNNYTYYIFAYNEEENIVRYIYCDSLENGADQPYYLELDW